MSKPEPPRTEQVWLLYGDEGLHLMALIPERLVTIDSEAMEDLAHVRHRMQYRRAIPGSAYAILKELEIGKPVEGQSPKVVYDGEPIVDDPKTLAVATGKLHVADYADELPEDARWLPAVIRHNDARKDARPEPGPPLPASLPEARPKQRSALFIVLLCIMGGMIFCFVAYFVYLVLRY